LEESPIRF